MAVYHRTQRLQIYGEKPEVTKLFGDRYRMVVRCKAARDTEAWYNDNKDQIFADFGTLYGAQMSVDGIDPRTGEAYPDMCLVSNSASYTQTGEYVISFVYETLTATWTKEQDDEITSTDNGLRVLQRSEVAKVDGFPIVKLSSPNSSKVVLSGMGNASNYFVLLVKANSANTIYWRATNDALATYTSSFTTANSDQWEYKVIYTPISIDQLEIGYDGTNYSTFDLSEFYVVSQSSDWQNNIVESFINFEVTVDNPSTFTDTVVFTGSNGNTATGTNVQSGGTGSVSPPYDEDDVGVATITDGGKTLYLANFQDQTGAESNTQVGRVVTRWAEAGTLSRTEDFIGSQDSLVIEAIGPDPSTPAGFSLASKQESNYEGFQTNRFTFLKPSILSVRTPRVGGQQQVVVSAFGMTSAEVGSDLSEVTANHKLVDQSDGDYEGIKTSNYTFEVDDFDVLSTTGNGLNQLTRTQLDTNAFTRGTVGTDTYSGLILAGEEIDNGNTIKKRVSRCAEAGLLDAYSEVNDGIRYVSFTSQGTRVTPTALNTPTYSLTSEPELAFQGGATAPIYRLRSRNVEGFKNFVTVVMLNIDGTPLDTGDEVTSFTTWENYNYPGVVDTSFDNGIVPYPGGNVSILVTISETLSTTGSVGVSPVPFSIKQGCSININYIPTATGLAASLNKAFGTNYLAGAVGLSGSNATFLGMDVSSIAGDGSSDPTYAAFLATSNPILERKIVDEFVTDEGVRWYRIRQKQLVGTFGNYG